ncbi:MAG TPA: hypothetical protein VFZ70_09155 [Euzebyales bacterium]
MAAVLSRLVEQSLVQAGNDRFWLLETLRAFAREQLDDHEHASLVRRHAHDSADRLSADAAALWAPEEALAVARLDALTPDLHAAWQ